MMLMMMVVVLVLGEDGGGGGVFILITKCTFSKHQIKVDEFGTQSVGRLCSDPLRLTSLARMKTFLVAAPMPN